MKKVSLDVWIQLVGMLSVVASLVFVAIEIRQSQDIAIAGQIQAQKQGKGGTHSLHTLRFNAIHFDLFLRASALRFFCN